ncbi:integrase catalytic domain-containing protein [Trichonephila clavata]|uniref:Integrase catalytic domain-containing protein n=1 Tax=Trichonephila clavata TaxID=2740835 RepID=A0A8X6L4S7_TRICU|nr:integrase catalytic domain-containing protein [Trichonephila clavata]
MAYRRFMGRSGLRNTIYTDNDTTFEAANKELITLWNTLSSRNAQQFYVENGIRWRFIVLRTAWWGGWSEKLPGIIKHTQCLRKTLRKALLDEENLPTVLVVVEAAINSRTLVYEEGIGATEEALTTGHFLTGQTFTKVPFGPRTHRVNTHTSLNNKIYYINF